MSRFELVRPAVVAALLPVGVFDPWETCLALDADGFLVGFLYSENPAVFAPRRAPDDEVGTLRG